MGFREQRDRDARLIILETLRAEPNATARDAYLADVLASPPNFIVKTPEAVRQYCRQLEAVGGVMIREVEGVFLATLAAAGRQHLDEVLALEGVTSVPELR